LHLQVILLDKSDGNFVRRIILFDIVLSDKVLDVLTIVWRPKSRLPKIFSYSTRSPMHPHHITRGNLQHLARETDVFQIDEMLTRFL